MISKIIQITTIIFIVLSYLGMPAFAISPWTYDDTNHNTYFIPLPNKKVVFGGYLREPGLTYSNPMPFTENSTFESVGGSSIFESADHRVRSFLPSSIDGDIILSLDSYGDKTGKLIFRNQLENSLFTHTMIIQSNGNVGIGTPTSNAKLEVLGDIKFSSFDKNTNTYFADEYGNVVFSAYKSSPLDGDINFQIYNNPAEDAFFIEGSTGDVGIGTTNPTSKLTIDGDLRIKGDFKKELGEQYRFRLENGTELVNFRKLSGRLPETWFGGKLKVRDLKVGYRTDETNILDSKITLSENGYLDINSQGKIIFGFSRGAPLGEYIQNSEIDQGIEFVTNFDKKNLVVKDNGDVCIGICNGL